MGTPTIESAMTSFDLAGRLADLLLEAQASDVPIEQVTMLLTGGVGAYTDAVAHGRPVTPGGVAPPAAACRTCGGWHGRGGMAQHRDAVAPVMGRVGCTC